MAKGKTLILDRKTIEKLVTIKDAMVAIENVFKSLAEGRVQMPAKIYIHLDEYKGDFRAMPAYVQNLGCCGLKWVNVHPENKKRGLPTVMALIVMSDPTNGYPLCVMDATYTTALRTGAAGGVAAKYLARPNSKKVALVGCGVQARTQLAALSEVFSIDEVNVCALSRTEALTFIKQLGPLRRFKFQVCNTVKACVTDCDIVVTTTSSRKPLMKASWIRGGTHINAIGADARGKQELDPALLKKATIVVDAWEQAAHSGEINVPLRSKIITKKDIYADIGEIVAGKKLGRRKKNDITVFDSTGLAIQDMALANTIYTKAVKAKCGTYVNII